MISSFSTERIILWEFESIQIVENLLLGLVIIGWTCKFYCDVVLLLEFNLKFISSVHVVAFEDFVSVEVYLAMCVESLEY
jgi:hypothetical protein